MPLPVSYKTEACYNMPFFQTVNTSLEEEREEEEEEEEKKRREKRRRKTEEK